ncbi:MAG TPA: DNA polymerase III subunit alpha, partial [Clostridiales bacterium]|nr:DNA polymerase III subunit alpha [Clostridiales bacterium]
DREANSSNERYNHLVLLAENNIGYQNLMKIVSLGYLEGFYYKPRVDYEVLEKYSEGIIALSACLAGAVSSNLRKGLYESAKKSALKLQDIFGKGNFYLELQDHGIVEQRNVNQSLLRISEETGIELVVTNDVHYTYEEDAGAHDILLCIQTQKKVSDEDRMRYEGGQYFIKSPEQMHELFPYASKALANTQEIAERCNVEITFGEYKLPEFDVPEEYNTLEYLRTLCEQGLKERYVEITPYLSERLNYEIETINNMGFVDYFIIVWDFIKYAKDHDIMVGPGRGSAAGSLVAYTLGITNIDPIKYNLLFERFLNPERVTMPDIDIDFCFERRQEVIDYVVRKYGEDKVAQIITFGTMAARGVIRDVGRALDYSYASVDQVAKMIPQEIGITISKALKINPELKQMYNNDEQIKYLLDMSMRLEGLPRHASTHAAGVVISKKPIVEYVPLTSSSEGAVTTQFSMTILEELGLLKMDFLGLRTLTVIRDALDLINRNLDKDNKIIIDQIDFEDKDVYDMISRGKTAGVFQLESAGMTSFMKSLKPNCMEDVIAGIALYRPGPMDFIPKYIEGKSNPDCITFKTKELESILSPTYGCIVYQEQVMQIVRNLAGYSFGRSDLVRRAMSKKKQEVMDKERNNFIYGNKEENIPGCINNGISEEAAKGIFEEMMDFAKYAFNKSHAAAYALISYQTAYLKYYYPVEFMAALMNSVIDNPTKVAIYIEQCRKMDIQITPPDINEGESGFSVSNGNIRYGLSAIKGLGKSVIDAIAEERNKNGQFKDLREFITRLSAKEVNKRTIESFIKSGAFDSIPGTRKQLMMIYVQILEDVTKEKKDNLSGQMSFFDFMGEEQKAKYQDVYPNIGEYIKEEILSFEKEVLGIYISGHPLESYQELLEKNITVKSIDFMLDDETNIPNVKDGNYETIGGIISSITRKTTKTNALMAFITIEDIIGNVEVIIFPRQYEKYHSIIVEEAKIFIRGRATVEEDKPAKMICQDILAFDDVSKEVWVRFKNKDLFLKEEENFYKLINDYEGKDQIKIYLEEEKAIKPCPPTKNIDAACEIIDILKENYGESNIQVTSKKI